MWFLKILAFKRSQVPLHQNSRKDVEGSSGNSPVLPFGKLNCVKGKTPLTDFALGSASGDPAHSGLPREVLLRVQLSRHQLAANLETLHGVHVF